MLYIEDMILNQHIYIEKADRCFHVLIFDEAVKKTDYDLILMMPKVSQLIGESNYLFYSTTDPKRVRLMIMKNSDKRNLRNHKIYLRSDN